MPCTVCFVFLQLGEPEERGKEKEKIQVSEDMLLGPDTRSGKNVVVMTTAQQEHYACVVPATFPEQSDEVHYYVYPSLCLTFSLPPFFSCSYLPPLTPFLPPSSPALTFLLSLLSSLPPLPSFPPSLPSVLPSLPSLFSFSPSLLSLLSHSRPRKMR